MQVARHEIADKQFGVHQFFSDLIGSKLIKSWNIFATRIFYFANPGQDQSREDDGDWYISIECPWRFEDNEKIAVGSEDYGVRANDNTDPNWNPTESQLGHLQDQKLKAILSHEKDGSFFNTGPDIVIDSVEADKFGGMEISLSGGFRLSLFPASSGGMEWMISRRAIGNLALHDGTLSGSAEPADQYL